MAQIPDTEKLSRIRLVLGAYDDGECDAKLFIDNVRWALDQEDVSDADMAAAIAEARRIRPFVENEPK